MQMQQHVGYPWPLATIVPGLLLVVLLVQPARRLPARETSLIDLAGQEDPEKLLSALEERPQDINRPDMQGWTPLLEATFRQRAANVELLVKAGADVNLADPSGRTPLHLAVANDTPALLDFLLAHGADPRRINSQGDTALSFASNVQRWNMALHLAKACSLPAGKAIGTKPLIISAILHFGPELQPGLVDWILYLLETPADFQPLVTHTPPLDAALCTVHTEEAHRILARMYDLGWRPDPSYAYILSHAIRDQAFEHLRFLLNHGFSVDMAMSPQSSSSSVIWNNIHGYRAVEEALHTRQEHPEFTLMTLQVLLDFHPDLEYVNPTGQTVLVLAIELDDTDAVKLLLAHGADIHHLSSGKAPMVGYARSREMARLLLAAGAEPATALLRDNSGVSNQVRAVVYEQSVKIEPGHWALLWLLTMLAAYAYVFHGRPRRSQAPQSAGAAAPAGELQTDTPGSTDGSVASATAMAKGAGDGPNEQPESGAAGWSRAVGKSIPDGQFAHRSAYLLARKRPADYWRRRMQHARWAGGLCLLSATLIWPLFMLDPLLQAQGLQFQLRATVPLLLLATSQALMMSERVRLRWGLTGAIRVGVLAAALMYVEYMQVVVSIGAVALVTLMTAQMLISASHLLWWRWMQQASDALGEKKSQRPAGSEPTGDLEVTGDWDEQK